MTITPEAPTRPQNLQVRTDPAGTPLAIRHDGQIWLVDPAADTQHWYGRHAWWDTRRIAAKGSGDLVSVEYWRVQARIIYLRCGSHHVCSELGSSRNARIIYP